MKHGVVPACKSWPGVISFSTTVPAIGERMIPARSGSGRFSWMAWIVARINAEGVELLQRRLAVGFGVGRVGLRLLDLLPGEVVVGKLLGQVGDAAGVLRGRHRLAVSADGRGVIRRGHRRQDVPGFDLRAERDRQPRDRPRDRSQDSGRLVIVEAHRAGRFNRAAEGGRLDRLGVDFDPLRRGQDDVAGHGGAHRRRFPGVRDERPRQAGPRLSYTRRRRDRFVWSPD